MAELTERQRLRAEGLYAWDARVALLKEAEDLRAELGPTKEAAARWLSAYEAMLAERDQLALRRDDQIRILGQMLLRHTKPADGEHCCNTISNAWGHSLTCINTPPFLHPDDRGGAS